MEAQSPKGGLRRRLLSSSATSPREGAGGFAAPAPEPAPAPAPVVERPTGAIERGADGTWEPVPGARTIGGLWSGIGASALGQGAPEPGAPRAKAARIHHEPSQEERDTQAAIGRQAAATTSSRVAPLGVIPEGTAGGEGAPIASAAGSIQAPNEQERLLTGEEATSARAAPKRRCSPWWWCCLLPLAIVGAYTACWKTGHCPPFPPGPKYPRITGNFQGNFSSNSMVSLLPELNIFNAEGSVSGFIDWNRSSLASGASCIVPIAGYNHPVMPGQPIHLLFPNASYAKSILSAPNLQCQNGNANIVTQFYISAQNGISNIITSTWNYFVKPQPPTPPAPTHTATPTPTPPTPTPPTPTPPTPPAPTTCYTVSVSKVSTPPPQQADVTYQPLSGLQLTSNAPGGLNGACGVWSMSADTMSHEGWESRVPCDTTTFPTVAQNGNTRICSTAANVCGSSALSRIASSFWQIASGVIPGNKVQIFGSFQQAGCPAQNLGVIADAPRSM